MRGQSKQTAAPGGSPKKRHCPPGRCGMCRRRVSRALSRRNSESSTGAGRGRLQRASLCAVAALPCGLLLSHPPFYLDPAGPRVAMRHTLGQARPCSSSGRVRPHP